MAKRYRVGIMVIVLLLSAVLYLLLARKNNESSTFAELRKTSQNVGLADSARIPAAEALVRQLEKSNDLPLRIETHLLLADLLDGEEKVNEYELALGLAKEFKLEKEQAQVLNKLGIAHRKQNNHSRAMEYHKQALVLAQSEEDKASFLNSQGITLMGIRDHDSARVVFAKANFLNLKNGRKSQAASVYNNLGLIAQREADYGESLFYYERALDTRKELSDTVEWARVLKNTSIVYNQLGDFAKAAENLLAAIELFEIASERKNLELASAYNSLGVAYVNLREYESAQGYYNEAIKLRRQINNLSGLSGSYNNLANLYRYTGKLDSAEHFLLRSIELKKRLKRENALIPNYKNLAEVYIEGGQTIKARLYIDSAINLNQQVKNSRLIASTHLTEILYYLELSDVKETRRALTKVSNALEKAPSKDLLLEFYNLSRKLHFLEKNATQAEEMVAKYDSLDDHLFEEQRIKAVRLKPQRENAELVWLAQQMEVDRAIKKRETRHLLRIIALSLLIAVIAIMGAIIHRRRSSEARESERRAEAEAMASRERAKGLAEKQSETEKGVQNGLAFFEDHLVIRSDSRDKKKATILPYKEIVLVKSNGDYLYWYTKEGGQMITRTTMSSITKNLNTHRLLRCHRSWIVHHESVKSLEELEDGSASLLLRKDIEVLTTTKTHKKRLIKQSIDRVPVGGAFLEDISGLFRE